MIRRLSTLKHIATTNAPKAIGPYSQAVVANGMVYTAGQIPFVPETMQVVPGGIQEQTMQSLLNLKAVLEASGSGFEHIVKTTVFLKDMNDFAKMNETYSEMMGDARPARSAVEVARLPRDVQVEIECVATPQSKPLLLPPPKLIPNLGFKHPSNLKEDLPSGQWDFVYREDNDFLDINDFYNHHDFPMLLKSKELYESSTVKIEELVAHLTHSVSSVRIISASKLLHYSQGLFAKDQLSAISLKIMVHHFEQLEQQTKISTETQVIIDAIVLETTIYLSLMYMMIVANKNDPAFVIAVVIYVITGNAMEQELQKKESWEFEKLPRKEYPIKTTPQDYYNHYLILMNRYPSYYIADPALDVPSYQPGMLDNVPSTFNKSFANIYQMTDPALENNISAQLEAARNGVVIHPLSEGTSDVPPFILESVELHKKYLYTSPGQIQIARERRLREQFHSSLEMPIDLSPIDPRKYPKLNRAKELYEFLLPDLPQNITMLVRLLFYLNVASGLDNVSIEQNSPEKMASLSPEERILELDRIDNFRHKEIVTFVISSILIMLLKSAKKFHILAFENICQILVDNNGPILILKMLSSWFSSNQNGRKKSMPDDGEVGIDFLMGASWLKDRPLLAELSFFEFCKSHGTPEPPTIPNIVEQSRGSADTLKLQDPIKASERNFHTTINLLRVLQKLTKNKMHRLLALVQWKASAVLKRMLKVNNPYLDLYALKVLKSQIPLLGKKWRSNNMQIISLIYQRLSHKLKEEYLAGEMEADADEAIKQDLDLRNLVASFNDRLKYNSDQKLEIPKSEHEPDGLDIALNMSLSETFDPKNPNHATLLDFKKQQPDLDENFRNNYQEWLDIEVYKTVQVEEFEEDPNWQLFESIPSIDFHQLNLSQNSDSTVNNDEWIGQDITLEEESFVEDVGSISTDEFTEGWTDGNL
ncbi:Factor arrest protein 11 [Boothiomyces sp. JEL0866]|nr:Factor arrest protein 11 [Boothiomyces sp. JEL0866]KAJ3324552.1 Factor arrest protein 11 [Boothiomyces sp. JEL0866]